jgi:hypothetical protein
VPQADGYPQVVFHPLAEDEPVWFVHLERQGIGRSEAPERDPLTNLREVAVVHDGSSFQVERQHHLQSI